MRLLPIPIMRKNKMGSINSNRVLLGIISIYMVSWVTPIAGTQILGYEGASLAIGTLKDGINYFPNQATLGTCSTSKALLNIIAGVCNILFIAAALMAFFRPTWSYLLTPFVVASMLVWFSTDVGVGYYLWLISGLSLFVWGLFMVRKSQSVALANIISGRWSAPIYISGLLAGTVFLLLWINKCA